jgi:hypothetical protein
LAGQWAEVIRPFECVHDHVGKTLCIPSQITVGYVVQVEEIIHKVAHEAETGRRAVVVAIRREFASLQAMHGSHLALGEVRRTGKDPFKRLGCDGIAFLVVSGREGAVRDKVWEDEEVGFKDDWSGR